MTFAGLLLRAQRAAALRCSSVSRSETLPQAEFISAEDVKSARRAPKRAPRVWEMQTEFNLGKNFL